MNGFESPNVMNTSEENDTLSVPQVSTMSIEDIQRCVARGRQMRTTDYGDAGPALARGAELGRFNMGSTVILLLPPGSARWSPTLIPEAIVRCRSEIGRILG